MVSRAGLEAVESNQDISDVQLLFRLHYRDYETIYIAGVHAFSRYLGVTLKF
jgi:hypothetical protein